jgi:hypothetical protein
MVLHRSAKGKRRTGAARVSQADRAVDEKLPGRAGDLLFDRIELDPVIAWVRDLMIVLALEDGCGDSRSVWKRGTDGAPEHDVYEVTTIGTGGDHGRHSVRPLYRLYMSRIS